MSGRRLVIIGGGLAGLSAGCYALASGFRVTIVEHNLTLGGVCTSWYRGGYIVDGCIHWLTGGPFDTIYRELGILPDLALRPLREFVTYRDAPSGASVSVCSDLDQLRDNLRSIAPHDADEIDRLIDGAVEVATMSPSIDRPPELSTLRDQVRLLGEIAPHARALLHFRGSVDAWASHRLHSPRLRRLVTRLVPEGAPALFLLMTLGYLSRGWISRPVGGSGALRDLLAARFHDLGGKTLLHSTVDEVIVRDDRACGVRLSDGSELEADAVFSTASAPETVFRLLGGRYGAGELRERMGRWSLFEPALLASFGVAMPFADTPPSLLIDGIAPFEAGGAWNDHLHLRLFNEGPEFAPAGHTVVQAMVRTDYDWWAQRGERYTDEKEVVADAVLAQIERHLPGVTAATRMRDVATPLTFWRSARAWRGAYEGWLPSPETFTTHLPRSLPGLGDFYMAGQWVEPGGGVPTALMSGRHVAQILCAAGRQEFIAPVPALEAKTG
jgi:phytoene dehydrogenase-like protein